MSDLQGIRGAYSSLICPLIKAECLAGYTSYKHYMPSVHTPAICLFYRIYLYM